MPLQFQGNQKLKTYARRLASCLMLIVWLGSGIAKDSDVQLPSGTKSLAEFLDADGQLIIPKGFTGSLDPGELNLVSKAGQPPRFAAKNVIDNGVNYPAYAIAVMGNDVYIGGEFGEAGGIRANHVARFNTSTQTWHTLGGGTTNGVNRHVYAIAVMGTDVFVGGSFDEAGGLSAKNIARFNTSTQTWSALGSGTANSGAFNGLHGYVRAIAILGTDVYVGGDFDRAGGANASYVARFNTITQAWSALGNGVNGRVLALVIRSTDVYVGGEFRQADGLTANYVARFNTNTQTWSSLGSGAANGLRGQVRALAIMGMDVFVGGDFDQAGGASANHVARFDTNTQTWSALGSGLNDGVSITVHALTILGTDVYVGGRFGPAGGVSANHVARFNTTTQTWAALGTGAAHGVTGPTYPVIYTLAVVGTDVYVGGLFAQAGATSANSVACFSTGNESWAPLRRAANGVGGHVYVLAIWGTDVYVGGQFTDAGGVSANNVARFNTITQTWSALGNGAANGVRGGEYIAVHALAITDADVYVAGGFTTAGGVSAKHVARYNFSSQTWFALGSGAANGLYREGFTCATSLAITGTDVYVGGGVNATRN